MVKELWTQHFDLHLVASILIVALCAVQAPGNGLQSFFEMTWLLIVTTLFLFGAALIADFYNVVILRQMLADGVAGASLVSLGPRGIVTWLEPAWLTMGAAGVYNLMKVFDTRMA
jgi:hypothetical protein